MVQAPLTTRRSPPTYVTLTDFATADGGGEYWPGATAGIDYTAAAGTATVAPGETSTLITVQVMGDRVAEGDEDFIVILGNSNYANVVNSWATGIIVDDEPYASIGSDTGLTEGNSGTIAVNFTVTLSAAYDAPVIVNYSTADYTATARSDYVAASGTLTFAPGQTSLPIQVLVKGDLLDEGPEYFYVVLTDATHAGIANHLAQVTIVDDDQPLAVAINDAAVVEGNSGTRLMTFTVTLSAAYDQPMTMSFKTVNGTAKTNQGDYLAQTGTLTFAPGETSKYITIEVKGDKKREANETFYLDLFGLSSNAVFTNNRGLGTILNDD